MDNKNVPVKEKLTKTLTYLKNMLFAIEDKIKQEKQALSRISNNLYNRDPLAARTDTTVILPNDAMFSNALQTTPGTPAAMFTFAPLFPTPPSNSFWPSTEITYTSVITDVTVFTESVITTTETLFMKDMKKTMREDRHNYFTAFLSRFMELIAIKKPHDVMPVIKLLQKKLTEKVDRVIFDEKLGKELTETLKSFFPTVSAMTPEELQEQAMKAHFALKNKETAMTPDHNKLTDFYGNYFNKTDGEKLFKALEAFYYYNTGRHSAAEVCDLLIGAALSPYIRVRDSGIDTTAYTDSTDSVTESPVTEIPLHVTKDTLQVTQHPVHVTLHNVHVTQKPVRSWRRKINYKQSVSHRQMDDREQSRERAYISSVEIYNHPKPLQDKVQNHMLLHKIRDASSYSDEEDHLRSNLYNALRYGIRT